MQQETSTTTVRQKYFLSPRKHHRGYHYIALDDVAKLFANDVKFMYVRCLGRIWAQISGSPMGSPCSDGLSNFYATIFDTFKNCFDEQIRHGRVRTARFRDDKFCFVTSTGNDPDIDSPNTMAQDFYSSHCPLLPVNDSTFCKLNVDVAGGLIRVLPDPVGSIVKASSAISFQTRKAIISGCFARLRQLRNSVGLLWAADTVSKSISTLRGAGYSFRTIKEQVRRHFPPAQRLWRLTHEAQRVHQ
jgi:hypothetical protein